MNKKKILVKILLVVLILIFVFLGFTVRKMLIIKDLNQKVAKYINNDNYYEKIINSLGTITEYYCKGDNAVLFLNHTVEKRKLANYIKGERTNTYIETEEDKIAMLNSNSFPNKIMIIGLNYGNNIWQLFQISAVTSIKSINYRDKECYILGLGYSQTTEVFIEKETGLILKRIDKKGTSTNLFVEYYYEFDNVEDSIFVEPDISEYTVKENN